MVCKPVIHISERPLAARAEHRSCWKPRAFLYITAVPANTAPVLIPEKRISRCYQRGREIGMVILLAILIALVAIEPEPTLRQLKPVSESLPSATIRAGESWFGSWWGDEVSENRLRAPVFHPYYSLTRREASPLPTTRTALTRIADLDNLAETKKAARR